MLDLVEWWPVSEVGLDAEPADAWAAQPVYDDNDDCNDLLFRYHNAVVYADGAWKIAHWDYEEQGIIIEGMEVTMKLAQERVVKELIVIWGKLGLM